MDELQQLKEEVEHLRKALEFEQRRSKPDVIALEMFELWVVRVSVGMKEAADRVRSTHANGYI